MSKSFEFTGLPGSGKSTVVETLSSKLSARGYRVVSFRALSDYLRMISQPSPGRLTSAWRLRRLLGKEVFVKHRGVSYDPFLREQIFSYEKLCREILSRQGLPKTARKNEVLWRTSELAAYLTWQQCAAKQQSNVVLLADEAFTHRSISYFSLYHGEPTLARTYFELCPRFEEVIHLDVATEIAVKRKKVAPWGDRELLHRHAEATRRQAHILRHYIAQDPIVRTVSAAKFSSPEDIAQEILGMFPELS